MLIDHYFSQLLSFSSTPHCQSLLQQLYINIEKPVLPFYSPVQDTGLPDDITLARLCADSYNPGKYRIADVTCADTQTLARLSLTPEQLRTPSGLQSMVYHYQDTGILAFAGSNDMADMMTNIRQGQGLPSRQYSEAVRLATHLLSHSSYPWLIIGHSLGGGLASLCAVVLQQPAVIFNAAGLAENTLAREGLSLKTAQQHGALLIRHYVLEHDWLTHIQDGLDIPKALGRRIALDYYPQQIAHSVLQKLILGVKAHMLTQVVTAMENRPERLL
ncbi:lipase family protein [Morganella psychrotolerans]|uniref:lipase family protein n=1 Tax=Morganella psychrotolerans TaxID=368603 RepID=UPI0039AF6826